MPEPRKTKVRENSIDLFSELMKALLVRTMAYYLEEYKSFSNEGKYEISKLKYQLEENGLRLEDLPSVPESVEHFRNLMEQATRKISVIAEDINDINYTARSLSPITYRGANKIVCVMNYFMPRYDKEKTVLTFHYVSNQNAANKLIEDFTNHITSDVKVIGLQKD